MSHPNDLDLDTRTIDLDTVDVLRLTVTDIHGQQRTCRHCVSGLQEAATNGCEVFAGYTARLCNSSGGESYFIV